MSDRFLLLALEARKLMSASPTALEVDAPNVPFSCGTDVPETTTETASDGDGSAESPITTTSNETTTPANVETLSASAKVTTPTTGVTLVKGKLQVVGTANADTITIAAEGTTKVAVTLNGTKTTYNRTDIKSLDILSLAGNDTVTINLPAALAAKLKLSVKADAGNDTITSNVAGTFDGGDGNDSITGSTGNDKITGGAGDDTLLSSGGKDSINAGLGTNKVTYANGDQDLGDLSLRTDKKGKLTITGGKANDTFTFAKGTGTNVTVTMGGQTATFDLSKVTSITVNGGAGQDKVVLTNNPLGTKPFSKKSIELT